MAPKKKAQKVSLVDFLASEGGGSWADEMELPSAPSMRTDDGFGKRDDFLSSRPDRGARDGINREDLPLPTQAPWTAFIGNLAFDLSESEVQDFFASSGVKTIKIIKDREDKPKGFGYVEFDTLDGLKDAIAKDSSSLSGRSVRVRVAEPPKGNSSFGGGFEDDAKFDSPWRRDGPLPDLPGRGGAAGGGDASRRRFEAGGAGGPGGAPMGPSASEGINDWRSMQRPVRAAGPPPSNSEPEFKRKTSNFGSPAEPSAADTEETWSKGSRFVPAPVVQESDGPRFGGGPRGGPPRGDMGPPKDPAPEDAADWRSAPRPVRTSRETTSPSDSTPPTPVMSRRKLELLPRSGSPSVSPSPLSSPRLAPAAASAVSTTPPAAAAPRASPFGAAKPVDVSTREKEVAERVEKERLAAKERTPHPMSRTSSRTGVERGSAVANAPDRSARGSVSGAASPATPSSASASASVPASPRAPAAAYAAVRPTMSFAAMAKAKREEEEKKKSEEKPGEKEEEGNAKVEGVTEKVAEVTKKVAEVTV